MAAIMGSKSFGYVLFAAVKALFRDFDVAAPRTVIAGMCPGMSECVCV